MAEAARILEEDELLSLPKHALIRRALETGYQRALELFRVG
jgi:hypothetical protein